MQRKLIGLAGAFSLLGVVFIGAPGCGSSDEKAEAEQPADKYPDTAAFCNGVAQAQCQQALIDACLAPSTDACISKVSSACFSKKSDLTRDAIMSNYPTGKANAEACLAAVTAVYADAKVTADEHKQLKQSCDKVFRNDKAKGASCSSDNDCADGLGCYQHASDATKHTCETITIAAKGDECSTIGTVCAEGTFCYNGEFCVSRAAKDAACDEKKPCLESLSCVEGKCADKDPQGTACTSDNDCTSGYCARIGEKTVCANTLTFGSGSELCQNIGGSLASSPKQAFRA